MNATNAAIIRRVLDVLERDGQPPNVLDRIEAQLRQAADEIGEADQRIELVDLNASVQLVGNPPSLGQRLRGRSPRQERARKYVHADELPGRFGWLTK